MQFIVKLFPEIIIKSAPVRKRFTRQLANNLVALLKPLDERIKVVRDWEKIDVFGPDEPTVVKRVTEVLACTPGVAFFYEVAACPFADLHDIYEATAAMWGEHLAGKTFCVRVKRQGEHDFDSMAAERYIGGGLNQHHRTGGVRLKKPDITINIEIRHNQAYVVKNRVAGLGGYPMGTQDPVLSLLSGGFDSTVASYLTMKRGLKTHFVFFNLGGHGHELGCKEVAHFLWQKFGASHRVKFVAVPFDEVVAEILKSVSEANMGVVLKRMMLRAAEQVAHDLNIDGLVTGESIAQVSSQTVANLSVIDRAIDSVVIRPLATTDKGDIIDIARRIGTEAFAANMPEYCGVISKRPSTKVKLERVLAEEASMDEQVLARALARTKIQSIVDVLTPDDEDIQVDEFAYVPTAAVVVDIRHPSEQERQPLEIAGTQVLRLPFYALTTRKDELNPGTQYLLYCDQGLMSRLHAAEFLALGATNVGVYRPN